MEYYESTCTQCGHRWQWTGYKTGIGKTEAQLEEMRVAGKTCPHCKGEAKRGLDMTSDVAIEMNSLFSSLFQIISSKMDAPSEPVPPSKPVPSPSESLPMPEKVQNNFGNPVMEVLHSKLSRLDPESEYRSRCLRCDEGMLLVHRDSITLEIQAEDHCILCGQRYRYLDMDVLRAGPKR
jgi:hypothetical protein